MVRQLAWFAALFYAGGLLGAAPVALWSFVAERDPGMPGRSSWT